MSVINWGIIGLGKIASNFASAFKDLKNSKIISIASQSNEKTEKFQKKFNLNNIFCYHNYEEMLSNERVDIIYIALPHNLHSKWILKCIDYKKKHLN